jgi:diguanylate cyclase (GGDEF)-like protein/PAS domain S-box-containing protein
MRVDPSEEAALLELLYLCPAAVLKFDAAGTIALMNPLGVQLLIPLSRDGNIENFFDILDESAPEIREMAGRFEHRVGRICDEHRVIHDVRSAKGTRSVILSVTMQKIDSAVFVAVVADVTAAAMREQLVRSNEERLHAVFDGVKEYGICTLDAAGTITSWNRAAERMEGYRSDEVLGTSAEVLLATAGTGRNAIRPLLEAARDNGSHEFEAWRIRKDGSRFWANSVISVLGDKGGVAPLGYSIVTRDLTQRKRSEDQLRVMAATDPLTGAYNRRAFYDTAVRSEERWRDEGAKATVLMLDLDHFKKVNDTYGHDAGDEALRHFVAIVHGEVRSADIIGRHGGEEFLVLLADTDEATAVVVADRIRERLVATPLAYEKQMLDLSVSIGVAQLGIAAHDMASLIRAADGALYRAKADGRNRVTCAPPVAAE